MQPDLENIKKKIKENRDLIDRITLKLPGFKGFVEEKESYEADSVIRDFLADKIMACKKQVDAVSGDLSHTGEDMKSLKKLDSVNMNFERIFKKTKHADYGKSSLTSRLKISEEDKNRLLEYDWRLIATLDSFQEMIKKLKKKEDFDATVDGIKEKIDEFEKLFDDRKYVIMEVI